VPYQKTEGRFCIAVNNSYRVAPWAACVWFGDIKWWDWHKEVLLAGTMPIVTCCENARLRHLWGSARIKFYRRDGNKRDGLTTRPGDFVSWNRSSGAAAISLAHRLGAKRVILLGFDMRLVGGQKNWHDDHIEKFHKPFYRHLKSFPAIARDARELGIEILNATPGSAIKQFPFVDLEEVL